MKTLIRLLWSALLTVIILSGCSGGDNPVQPQQVLQSGKSDKISLSASQRKLWGIWDIGIDLETLSAVRSPDRAGEAHFNILPFLQPPQCNDCLKLHVNSFDPVTHILNIDVTLRNPFEINGYDVRGIVFTNDLGHLMINDDAWTGLYDPPGGDIINPFRAYAKDDPQRKFPGLAELTENYLIQVPAPPQFLMIKYAVDASWPNNCREPYAIENFTQAEITSEVGSHGVVTIDVKDWQGDVNQVSLEAPGITGEPSTLLTHQSGDTWSVDLVNNTDAAVGDYPVKFAATSTGSGTQALYKFFVITLSEPSSQVGWARTWGGGGSEYGNGVAVDGDGSIYIAGSFSGTADFDPGPGVDTHTSNAMDDVFLSKLDSNGNFQWARTWGGGDYGDFDRGYGVAVDGSGNVYITGHFSSVSSEPTVDFDPGPGVDLHSAIGEADAFLSKFDSNGDFQWARTWGGSKTDVAFAVADDGNGNTYITGYFRGTADFDPGPGIDNHTATGYDNDVFLSKIDSNGDFQWARTWGINGWDEGHGVAVDGYGNAFVTGFFSGANADFDPGPDIDNHTSNGDMDIFLSKFDPDGNFQWACVWGGSSFDFGNEVAVDENGNAYINGWFCSPAVDFDPGTSIDNHELNGGSGVFLSKIDSNGDFQWANTWSCNAYSTESGVDVDSSGNTYVTGSFQGTVDFNPGPGVEEPTPFMFDDVFLSKFDSDGDFQWARIWGRDEHDSGNAVAIDGSGNAFVTGFFGNFVDFDPGPGYDNHYAISFEDVFLTKIPPDGNW